METKWIAAVVASFLLVPAIAHAGDVVQQLAKSARSWEERGRDDKAGDAWEKLLRANPDNAEALTALTAIRAHAGQSDEARSYLARLEAAHPDSDELPGLRRSLELGKRYGELLAEARALVKRARFAEAIARYREAFGGGRPPPALVQEYFQTLGGTPAGWDEAVAGLRSALARHADDVRLKLALGEQLTYREPTRLEGIQLLRGLTGDPAVQKEAIAAWKEALLWLPVSVEADGQFTEYLKRFPSDAEIAARHERLAKGDLRSAAVQEGYDALHHADVHDAEKYFEAAGSEPDALLGQAVVALKREEFEKARTLLEQVKAQVPDRPAMWEHALKSATFWSLLKQAKTARDQQKLDVAEAKLLEAATVSAEERPSAELELGNLYLSQNAWEKAEPHLRFVLDRQPDQAEALRALVTVLAHTGRGPDATALNEKLAKVSPGKAYRPEWLKAEDLRGQAAQSQSMGNLDEARALLQAARKADPSHEWVLHDLANLELEFGNLDTAAELVRDMVAQAPELTAARATRIRLLDLQGKTAEALVELGALKPGELTPDLEKLRRGLEVKRELDRIAAIAARGATADARLNLVLLEHRVQGDTDAIARVAEAWADVGDFERALSLMRDDMARVSSPTPALRLQLATILMKAGDELNLQAQLAQLRDDPELTPQERRGLADLRVGFAVRKADQLRGAGEPALALEYLKPALQDLPDDARLLCALARLFASRGSREDAYAVYRRVLQTNPGNMEAREGAAGIALLLGRQDEAQRLIREGTERAPGDPRAHLLAGRFWSQQGDDGRAVAELEQAQALAATAAVREAIRSPQPFQPTIGGLPPDSSTAAFLNRASAGLRPPGTPDATAEDAPALENEINQELDRIRARHRLEVDADVETRVRQGEEGLGALTELRLPVTLGVPLGYSSRLSFGVVPVFLDAGSLDLTNPAVAQLFGSSQNTTAQGTSLSQTAEGAELLLAYQYKSILSVDVGSTPLGFRVPNVTGGVAWHDTFGAIGVGAEVSRRPVTDSLLTYAGTNDPATGITWGGVVKQGGRLDVGLQTGPVSYYAFADGRYLTGLNVPDNASFMGGAGVHRNIFETGENTVVGGVSIVGMGYEKNLQYFTLGNGGYFSPQTFVHAGVPLRWRRSGKLQLDIGVEPGLNWFRENSQVFFPADPALQQARAEQVNPDGSPVQSSYPGQATLSFALDVRTRIAYPLTDDLKASLAVDYHTSADYQELVAMLALQFDFATRRAVNPGL